MTRLTDNLKTLEEKEKLKKIERNLKEEGCGYAPSTTIPRSQYMFPPLSPKAKQEEEKKKRLEEAETPIPGFKAGVGF